MASGSVMEECVSFLRFSPWKSRGIAASTPRTFPEGGLPSSLSTKLFMLARASINVRSTEKCSLDKSLRTCGRFSTPAKNLAAISPSSKRSGSCRRFPPFLMPHPPF